MLTNPTHRVASGGTLILGGGYAGAYVARRLRVPADWTAAAVFRRDVAELTAVGGGR